MIIFFYEKINLPTTSFEYYLELDELGWCGVACVNIGQDIMSTEEREGIGQIIVEQYYYVDHLRFIMAIMR